MVLFEQGVFITTHIVFVRTTESMTEPVTRGGVEKVGKPQRGHGLLIL